MKEDNITYEEQKQLLTEFCEGNELAFGKLYGYYYKAVEKYIIQNTGTTEDAQDIFQETLIIFLKKLQKDDFYLTASLKTYLVAISKNIWLNILRKRKKNISYSFDNQDWENVVLSDDFDIEIEKEKPLLDKMYDYFSHLTSHCQNLLTTIVSDEKSTEEMQSEFGYTTRHNFNNQKHKCVKQLKKVKALAEAKQSKQLA